MFNKEIFIMRHIRGEKVISKSEAMNHWYSSFLLPSFFINKKKMKWNMPMKCLKKEKNILKFHKYLNEFKKIGDNAFWFLRNTMKKFEQRAFAKITCSDILYRCFIPKFDDISNFYRDFIISVMKQLHNLWL